MKHNHLTRRWLALAGLALGGGAGTAGCQRGLAPEASRLAPPAQPATGPGGSSYAYAGVTKTAFVSNGVTNYIFQPAGLPAGTVLPCIAFQHGFSPLGSQLAGHQGFINHLVRKGYTIIYDNFQPLPITRPRTYEANAATIIRAGLAYLASHPATCAQVATDASGARQFGLMGYSVGGVTSINLAANYVADSIPRPKFLYTMEANNGGGTTTPVRDAGTIPATTYVAMVMAQDDDKNTYASSATAWHQLTQVPAARKQWLGLYSDRRAPKWAPQLVADHFSPFSKQPDALDYYGYYKWGTALANYAFFGTDETYWHGMAPTLTDMGTRRDGTPVAPARASQQAFWPGHEASDSPVKK